ncbi:peptidase S10 [Sphingomonas sp. MMSM20]|uniref:S10 family peptidase n=1 Tax=Sphingomonas lycopersici TaxID=2951807 RepID=UPI002236FE3C|nr:peptidase S10 [Sphingomonas lycopersici]MCW6530873.1 peptidase S10 [Sphingomonas lycopersici]
MRLAAPLLASALAMAIALPTYAADKAPRPQPAKHADEPGNAPDDAARASDKADTAQASAIEYSVSRHRSIPFHGATLGYTVTPGTLTIRNDEGEPIASMFYTAYVADASRSGKARPITFMYNGGPGSSSMWLHMGSYGPLKVDVPGLDALHGEPGRLVANPDTILDRTDIVFLDAIGTGLSRPLGKATGKDFWSVDGDLDAFARGIQRYLTINNRWASPKFLLGESYGTTRTGGLAYVLQQRGVQLAGATIMSTVLNIPLLFDPSVDQMHVNAFPTFAATAWYHNRVANKLADLDAFAKQAQAFATGPYAAALSKGDRLTPEERTQMAQQASALLGVSPDFLLRTNLRPGPDRFRKELLRDQRRTVGRLDSRFDGIDVDAGGDSPEFDAANEAISGAFIAAINNYLFNDLGYQTKLSYRPNFYSSIGPAWDWKHRAPGNGRQFAANTSVDLSQAMRQNPKMKLLSLNGYYDIATPFAGADYDLEHMELDPALKANITYKYYPSGHMIYIEPGSAARLRQDIDAFYDSITR